MSLSVAIGAISGFNECVTFWEWAKSAISSLHSRWSGSQEQDLQGRVLELESGLRRLRDTLPAMHDLINKAEWRSHDDIVATHLLNLKDAVYEAEDLLDEFSWYEKKVQVEGDASQSPFTDFLDTVVQGSFNQVNDVQLRLNDLSNQMENMGLRGVAQRFDKLVRPETISSLSQKEKKNLFGRDKELKQVLGFLNVLKRKRATSSINASTSNNHVNSESSLHVSVIGGIGGVGKTTLTQHIFSHQQVTSQFEKRIWICVSDDFDVKRLTKEVLQSFTRMEGMEANGDSSLESLQFALKKHVKNKRLLIVLDDMWDDALRDNGQCWEMFCAPFSSVQEGSAMLVTTRCPNVTKGVCTMETVTLHGLKDDVFRKFFRLCAYGAQDSSKFPELELIGESILPKLKGSPLGAITLGRMLSRDLQASHWNSILHSELWELKQKETEILPALRLSYIYLPLYLKRCFAFCAVYPKDYKFEKACLAEIWVAEGFVGPQGGVPLQDIGCQYFEDLVARSFFQKVNDRYVIHDLLHDMAQMVSEHDCFALRNKSDFDKVPQNVRHLYVLPSSDFDDSDLLRLCKYTKLRTLICMKTFGKETGFVMDQWCVKLHRMRVISFAYARKLPDSIGNWKHLRYLEIFRACPLMKRIPPSFCWLYNLQILYAKKCRLESLPVDFGKLTSLQKFEPHGLRYYAGGHMIFGSADGHGQRIKLIKNLNQFRGHLQITTGILSKHHGAELELMNKKYLDKLTLNMLLPEEVSPESKMIRNKELLQVLRPPISLKSLHLNNYAGVSLSNWFQPQNLPDLKSLTFSGCVGISSLKFSQSINLNDIPAVGVFLCLTDLTIKCCRNISSLENFLHPDYVPAIKKIAIERCKMLASLPTEKFGDFHFLEQLDVCYCPNINIGLQRLVSPSLKRLCLLGSGVFCNIDCSSLTNIHLSCAFVTSIKLESWSVPSLLQLTIVGCRSLTSIGGSITAFPSLKVLTVYSCDKLPTLDDFLTQEYGPFAIEKIDISSCSELLSLPVERFMSFPTLKHLVVYDCPSLNWQRGLVMPSYLQSLSLRSCGDISPYVPSCLENLTSLVSLSIGGCQGITSIPGNIWRSNLASLEKLKISDCPDLVSIGGAKAVAKTKNVDIDQCPNLKEADQINRRSRQRGRTR